MSHIERLEALAIPTRDDGLIAYCDFREQWELETDCGTEYVPCDVEDITNLEERIAECTAENGSHPGDDESAERDILLDVFGDHIEGRKVYSGERVSRWCARWSMPGYMDHGAEHCADSESGALVSLLEFDGSSEPLDEGISEWEHDILVRLAQLADDGDQQAADYLVRDVFCCGLHAT